tara:strand:- start:7808 stop:8755 length:948 start_codon:yes stop_codon:yes gene_type:complete
MKRGLKVRFHDAREMLKFNVDVYEFHFSDKDLSFNFGNQKYDQELVVHGPEYWEGKLIDPASDGTGSLQHTREKSVEIIQVALDKTNEIAKNFKGKPKFVLHPGGMSLKHLASNKHLLENLKKSLSELRCGDVEILLENMPPFPWFFGGQWCCNILLDAKEIHNFLNETGHNMCFDLSHAQLYCNHSEKDIIEFIKKVNPLIQHTHIADADGVDGEGLQIDEGEIDFASTLGALRKDNITMIPEIWRGHEHGGEGFRIAFDRLKKYIDDKDKVSKEGKEKEENIEKEKNDENIIKDDKIIHEKDGTEIYDEDLGL